MVRLILSIMKERILLIGLCCGLFLVGPWGVDRARAEKMLSEMSSIHDATDIPSQLERGLNPPSPTETAEVLPEIPLEDSVQFPFIRDASLALKLRLLPHPGKFLWRGS